MDGYEAKLNFQLFDTVLFIQSLKKQIPVPNMIWFSMVIMSKSCDDIACSEEQNDII